MNAKSNGWAHCSQSLFLIITLIGAAGLLSACATSQEVSAEETAVVICHKNKRTITLPEHKLEKHLDHGDTVGACL